IMGNNIPRLKEVKDYLGKCFFMKDLGEASYILGIKIYRDRSRRLIGLSQSACIDKILKKYNMYNSKKGYLPMEVKHDLSNELCASTLEEVAYMKKVPYALAVGSIMYVVRCIRLNVAFAQNIVSRYQQNPGKLHWIIVKHILKYLRNTRDTFLVYGVKPDIELDVTSFCDESWQCDKDDTKSQTGYVFIVNGRAIDWKSKKQTTIAMHSAYHYVQEQVETGEIKLIKVHTDDNIADPFTKPLPRGMVIDHAKGIGLQLASSFMRTCDYYLDKG
nr:retrotransposon protein, putative, Ty1-copia subclass [Tanacetum cinerariifolium]